METSEFLIRHGEICDNLKEVVKNKNADYSGTKDPFKNFNSVELFDITSTERGFLTRMCDKFNRIITITNNGVENVNDEKITDTLIDLANYAILMSIYIENKKK